jgi:hypothetical protein
MSYKVDSNAAGPVVFELPHTILILKDMMAEWN